MFNSNIYEAIKFQTDNFMKLIDAQGYLFKWERASRCTCYSIDKTDFDYKCPICKGRGYNYSTPTNNKTFDEQAVVMSTNSIKVKFNPTRVSKIYRKKTNEEFSVSSILNNTITLNENSVGPSYGMFVSYENTLVKQAVETTRSFVGQSNQIRVKNKYINSIVSIRDITANIALSYSFFTDTLVKLTTNVDNSHDITITYQYAEPIKAIMTSMTESKHYLGGGETLEGDMQITFSPAFDIGESDRITLLDSEVVTRKNELLQRDVVDFLKHDIVANIIEVRDRDRLYYEGTDFMFDNVKGIVWLQGGNAPASQEMYSVTYNARREYIVWKEIAQERYHGQIILPRRMIVRKIERYNFLTNSSFPEAVS